MLLYFTIDRLIVFTLCFNQGRAASSTDFKITHNFVVVVVRILSQ